MFSTAPKYFISYKLLLVNLVFLTAFQKKNGIVVINCSVERHNLLLNILAIYHECFKYPSALVIM